jgi:hypothetical protein
MMPTLRNFPLLLALALCGCGALASGAGTPVDPPASGLGPAMPWSDDRGLDWSPPFILADPAQSFSHPSAFADGAALELWAEALAGGTRRIVHARADSFEQGFGATDDVLAASLPWHDGVGSPALVRAPDGGRYLFYLSAGQIGLLGPGGALRQQPLYADPAGAIDSIAAAALPDEAAVVLKVGPELLELRIGWDLVARAAAGAEIALTAAPTGVGVPAWATQLLDVGLRIEPTPAGRLREDLFFTAALPSAADLGSAAPPSAIGAAARYLDAGEAYAPVPTPILSGSPAPHGPTALGYAGGVLLLYAAQSGPRDAIGVARHP